MREIHLSVDSLACQKPVVIGVAGEYGVTRVIFDYSAWASTLGSGTFSLRVQRPGELDIYDPAITPGENDSAAWEVSSVDTALAGMGRAQCIYRPEHGFGKSLTFGILIADALVTNPEPPDPYEDWLARMEEIAQETAESAEAAADSAEDAANSATAADTSKTAAETARDAAQQSTGAASDSANAAALSATASANSATDADTAKSGAESARDAAVTAKESAEAAHVAAVQSAGAAAESATDANAAKTAAQAARDAAQQSATAAAQAQAGAETAQRATETALSAYRTAAAQDEIDALLGSTIPGTTQTVTFNANGKPASIVHTANNAAVRTDVFTWGANSVTELRTLANGKHITMTTNLTTLETVISGIEEAI